MCGGPVETLGALGNVVHGRCRDCGMTTSHTVPSRPRCKSVRAVCPDGKVRAARIADQPSTAFSIPARVKARGKTVTGYVTGNKEDDPKHPYLFCPYTYGLNWYAVYPDEYQPDGENYSAFSDYPGVRPVGRPDWGGYITDPHGVIVQHGLPATVAVKVVNTMNDDLKCGRVDGSMVDCWLDLLVSEAMEKFFAREEHARSTKK